MSNDNSDFDTANLKTFTAFDGIGTPEHIGHYKLLQKLGEGGMGEVYLAEQVEPIRRRVALKLIKHGMDTRKVVARFASERQALALMEHPNIAKVYDAGATDQGRPFFAMEYVKGEPISAYCDRHRLPTRKRLELFTQVCKAVQHAHQKGIIHRDIKPSNVLISIQGDAPVPKIIDFGVAKATAQRLTEDTIFTEIGQIIGTPEYMSPEQAEMTSLDIDTRTDIYSLGVLLYELLVGELPFDSKDLRKAGIDEVRRKIREDEPLKPSARLSSLGDHTTETAERRAADPVSLTRMLRGDLDWIVMKALEKDRTRRYETASEFALDVERYLHDEPVLASPPSTVYRFRKFVRRNHVLVTASALVVTAALTGLALASIGFVQASRERDRARTEAQRAQAVVGFIQGMMDNIDPAEARGRAVPLREVLDAGSETIDESLDDQPLVAADLAWTFGLAYRQLGSYEQAEPRLTQALQIRTNELGPEQEDTLKALNALAILYFRTDRVDEAEEMFARELEIRRRLQGNDDKATLNAMQNLAAVYLHQKRYDESIELAKTTLDGRVRVLGEDHERTMATKSNLGTAYKRLERYDEAEPLLLEVHDWRLENLGELHPRTIGSKVNLVSVYHRTGRYDAAAELSMQAYEGFEEVLGATHPNTLTAMRSYVLNLIQRNELDDAQPLALAAYERHVETFGADSSRTKTCVRYLAALYEARGDDERAAEWQAKIASGS